MLLTSAQAAKLLRKLNEEESAILEKEKQVRVFSASLDEALEDVRPEYDFHATDAELSEKKAKIRKLKHAINVFNSITVVEEFGMTIDEMLVYIPQLTKEKERLSLMKSTLPKTRRVTGYGSGFVEYTYANFSTQEVAARYEEVAELLARAQTALDVTNNTVTFEFEF